MDVQQRLVATSASLPCPVPKHRVPTFDQDFTRSTSEAGTMSSSLAAQELEDATADAMDVDPHTCSSGSGAMGSPGTNLGDSDLTLLRTLLDLAATKRADAAKHCEKFTEMLEQTVSASASASPAPSPLPYAPSPSPSSSSTASVDVQCQLYYEDQHSLYSVRRVPSRKHPRSLPRRSHDGDLGRRSTSSNCSTPSLVSSPCLSTMTSLSASPFLPPDPGGREEALYHRTRASSDSYMASTTSPSPSPQGVHVFPPSLHQINQHFTPFPSPFASTPKASLDPRSCPGTQSNAPASASSVLATNHTTYPSSLFLTPASTSVPSDQRRHHTIDTLSPQQMGQQLQHCAYPSMNSQQVSSAPLTTQKSGGFADFSSRSRQWTSKRRHGLDLRRGEDGWSAGSLQLLTDDSSSRAQGRGGDAAAFPGAASTAFLGSSGEQQTLWESACLPQAGSEANKPHKAHRSRRLGLDLPRNESFKDLSLAMQMNGAHERGSCF